MQQITKQITETGAMYFGNLWVMTVEHFGFGQFQIEYKINAGFGFVLLSSELTFMMTQCVRSYQRQRPLTTLFAGYSRFDGW